MKPLLTRRSVVSLSRLDLVSVFGLDLYLPEGTVVLVIGRRVTDAVLAAQLF